MMKNPAGSRPGRFSPGPLPLRRGQHLRIRHLPLAHGTILPSQDFLATHHLLRQPARHLPPPARPIAGVAPKTQTPTITGTGVTTTSGGMLPGAPNPSYLFTPPKRYKGPKLYGYTPAEWTNMTLGPQYQAVDVAEQKYKQSSAQEQAALQGFTGQLGKMLGQLGPHGEKGTLGPEYAASLGLLQERNLQYQHFQQLSDFAAKRAEIAAQAPTLYNQYLSQVAQQAAAITANRFKQAQLDLERQAYGLKATTAIAGIKARNTALGLQAKSLAVRQSIAADASKRGWAGLTLQQQKTAAYLANQNRQFKLQLKRIGITEGQLKLAQQKYLHPNKGGGGGLSATGQNTAIRSAQNLANSFFMLGNVRLSTPTVQWGSAYVRVSQALRAQMPKASRNYIRSQTRRILIGAGYKPPKGK
jgi:hypothetical protein